LGDKLTKMLDQIVSVPRLSLETKGAISLLSADSQDLVLKVVHGFSEDDETPCSRVPLGTCHCGKAITTGRILFSSADDGGHEMDYRHPAPHGHYCVPILAGDRRPLGLLNVFVKEGHGGSPEEERFLAAVADTLAAVIERHQSEKEKQVLQRQLVQAEKMAALGRITANMAHEIRNPLTTVGGLTRRLDKTVQPGARKGSTPM